MFSINQAIPDALPSGAMESAQVVFPSPRAWAAVTSNKWGKIREMGVRGLACSFQEHIWADVSWFKYSSFAQTEIREIDHSVPQDTPFATLCFRRGSLRISCTTWQELPFICSMLCNFFSISSPTGICILNFHFHTQIVSSVPSAVHSMPCHSQKNLNCRGLR